MNIQGVAEIRIYDLDMNLIEEFTECNDINWLAWRRFFHSWAGYMNLPTKRDVTSEINNAYGRWQIYYGATDIHPTHLLSFYPSDGVVNVSQDSPTYTTGALVTDPDILTFNVTIPAPVGADRTIRVLGLQYPLFLDGATFLNNLNTSPTIPKATILRLNTPCIQSIGNIVSVTYRLYLHPLVIGTDHRINYRLYEDMRLRLKAMCDAVASYKITVGSVSNSLVSTAFEISENDNLAIRHVLLPGTLNTQVQELTDNGLNRPHDSGSLTITPHNNVVRFQTSYTVSEAPATGCFVKYIAIAGQGNTDIARELNRAALYQEVTPGITSPLQNVFPQRNSPVGPFQDLTVNNTATMTGTINLDPTNWTDPKLQKLVKIKIVTGGAVGVATYKAEVGLFIGGFVGNRWVPRTAILPQTLVSGLSFRKTANDSIYETGNIQNGGIVYRTNDGYRYVIAANCNRQTNGVNIYDIISGERYSMNSAVGLNVTAVSDAECSKGYFFVTCANTGLWRISSDRTVIENIPSPTGVNKAYQISVKNDVNGTVWVMFDGGLCKLSNPDAILANLTWSVHNPTTGSPFFSYTGITDSKWDTVTSMVIDPDEAGDDRFLFLSTSLAGGVTSSGFRLGFVWWSTGTGLAVNPSTSGISWSLTWNLSNLLGISDHIRCSEGRWFNGTSTYTLDNKLNHFQFGSNNLSATQFRGNFYQRGIPATINGIKGILGSDSDIGNTPRGPGFFIKNSTFSSIPYDHLISLASPYIEFLLRVGTNSYNTNMETQQVVGLLACPLVYLPESNMFFTHEKSFNGYGVTPFMLQPTHALYNIYKGAFWKEYGWDGADWVLDEGGSKPTHAGLETLPFVDDMDISFTNGGSGTSFVANEFFTTTVGKGLMKDNGTTYNCNFVYSFDSTERITFNTTVPTVLGALTDEPVTFQMFNAAQGSTSVAFEIYLQQNKGLVVTRTNQTTNNGLIVSDQLIPASTPFNFRFKWVVLAGFTGQSSYARIGVATGTSTYTFGLHFRFNLNTGNLEVYNNTTLVGSVSNPDINTECSIVRDGSNGLAAYYGGVQIGSTIAAQTSQYVILANSADVPNGAGWWDMKLTYTENRKILRLGDNLIPNGSFHPDFCGLTNTALANDAKVYIGSGTPLEAILDYTSAGTALTGTGRVKIAPGAGWLVFHDSEPANPITGFVTAHYTIDNP